MPTSSESSSHYSVSAGARLAAYRAGIRVMQAEVVVGTDATAPTLKMKTLVLVGYAISALAISLPEHSDAILPTRTLLKSARSCIKSDKPGAHDAVAQLRDVLTTALFECDPPGIILAWFQLGIRLADPAYADALLNAPWGLLSKALITLDSKGGSHFCTLYELTGVNLKSLLCDRDTPRSPTLSGGETMQCKLHNLHLVSPAWPVLELSIRRLREWLEGAPKVCQLTVKGRSAWLGEQKVDLTVQQAYMLDTLVRNPANRLSGPDIWMLVRKFKKDSASRYKNQINKKFGKDVVDVDHNRLFYLTDEVFSPTHLGTVPQDSVS